MSDGPSDRVLLWRWFRRGWAGEGRRMAWLLVGSAGVAVGYAAFTGLWRTVLEDAQTGSALGSGSLLVAIGVAQSVLYVGVQSTRTWMNHRIQQTTRDTVFTHLSRVGPAALRGRRVGDLVTRLTDDISEEKLSWFLCSGVFRAYEALLVALAGFAGMVWIHPILAVQTLAPLPVLVLLFVLTARNIAPRAGRVQAAVSRVATVVTDSFDGVRVIQARGLGGLARRAFAEATAAQAEAEVDLARLTQANFLLFAYGWQLAMAVLLWSGGLAITRGDVSAPDFVGMSGFLLALVFQMFDLAAFVVRGRVAAASLRRLEELLDLPTVAPAPGTADAAVVLPARLEAPHLVLSLDGPLCLGPGQMLAVAGPVGAGKSTLLRALAGEEPGVGGIRRPARAAWVPQEPAVWGVSIRENITLGGEAPVAAAVAAACLDTDLARFPEGLDTLVGERGVTLSGGQQQRVQLARALASGAGLFLLDDATSALDADTEARFWAGFPRADRVVVVATHRPATLAQADLVLYLRGGVEVARGRHAELLDRVPAYRAAYGSRPLPEPEAPAAE